MHNVDLLKHVRITMTIANLIGTERSMNHRDWRFLVGSNGTSPPKNQHPDFFIFSLPSKLSALSSLPPSLPSFRGKIFQLSRWRFILENLIDDKSSGNRRQVKHLNQYQRCFTARIAHWGRRGVKQIRELGVFENPSADLLDALINGQLSTFGRKKIIRLLILDDNLSDNADLLLSVSRALQIFEQFFAIFLIRQVINKLMILRENLYCYKLQLVICKILSLIPRA